MIGPRFRLATLPEEIPELTLGWEAMRWAVKYLRQPNGPRAGERFQFIDSQLLFLLHWYAVDEDGEWVYHRAARRLAKGSGKSPFAAVMALIEFLAPVRLKDFDPKAPGGCVGKPVGMPLVQIAATAEAQTENTMRMVRAFTPKGSRVVRDYGLDKGMTLINGPGEGKLHVLTSSARASEGAEATFVVADETEHWLPATGGPVFHSTLVDNLAKSGSRMLETSNAWEPGIDSVAEDTWDEWVAQEEGKSLVDQKILYDARMAPYDTDPRNDDSLRRALEWVYNDCWWQSLTPLVSRIRTNKNYDESCRKYFNWPTTSSRKWVRKEEWGQCYDPDRRVLPGEEIVMFFDGSRTRDATALVGCCMSDGFVFKLGVWESDNKHDGSFQMPVEEIDAVVDRAMRRYSVVAFFGDVKEWEGYVKQEWPNRYRDDLQLWAIPNGQQPEPIAWDMRIKRRDFVLAAEMCESDIREGRLSHDGDEVIGKHVLNAHRYETPYGISVRKETPSSPDKIDAAVCVIGARMAWRLAQAADLGDKRTGEAMFI